MQKLKEIEVQLQAAPDKQISQIDPDARAMKSQGTGIVGCNVQTAVDAKHHLIVAHVVTNVGSDREQLSSMAKLARSEMGAKDLTAIADRGYFNAPEIQACHEASIDPIVAKSLTSGASADGRFGKADFIFDAKTDTYRCPAVSANSIWICCNWNRASRLSPSFVRVDSPCFELGSTA